MSLRNIFSIPSHNYFGPGISLSGSPPTDTDDVIAMEHDLAYENASDKNDIHEADKKAIFAFIIDCFKNKNWHSAIGAIGIGLKHLSEVICGRIFYPRLPQDL